MSLKTRVLSWATIAGLLVVGALHYGVFDRNENDPLNRTNDVDILLHVTFDPSKPKPLITVQLSDTLPVTYMAGDVDPWERTMRAPRATRVTLTVTMERHGYVECAILREGNVAGNSPQGMNGPGVISCQYLVI